MHVAKMHKEVKQVAFFAYHFHNKKAVYEINHILIPQLVRLDLETMMPEVKEVMGDNVVKALKKALKSN